MLRMFRLRRYRVFVIIALVLVVLAYRFTNTIAVDEFTPLDGLDFSSEEKDDYDRIPLAPSGTTPETLNEKAQKTLIVQKGPSVSTNPAAAIPSTSVTSSGTAPTIPPAVLPDRTITPDKGITEGDGAIDDIHPIAPPGRQELSVVAGDSTIHWEKQTEHFPVPTESIIRLPTGPPVAIPKIQHKFNDETPDAKINREKRQVKVKEEFKKAWVGYRKHAWMHDELSPISGGSRDPFCGWAATLVDTLDTLWIMGLEEEFEDAVKAVEQIDFTTTPRDDIPVFETTIRYLGGLLAAYDVSGGKYKILLDKAVELGEILMGTFDTPNRMPVLYYRWKPAFASQPHRASQRSNLAELGSLTMEFTRLAQLTKEPRYYDAVARVTDALSEYQDRGTKLGNVFPENIDASGCNRTAPQVQAPVAPAQDILLSPAKLDEEPEGYKPDMPETVREPRPNKKSVNGNSNMLEMEIIPGDLNKAHISESDEKSKSAKSKVTKRESAPQAIISDGTTSSPTDPVTGLPVDLSAAKARVGTALGGDWDCTPQGLDSPSQFGPDKFSMGGGQDSTYEYFPKEYLLLGGREEKYKKLYLKIMEDVRKWMLFRPMVPGDRDILFSAAVTTSGKPTEDLNFMAEVEHLTCFIGGMVGMGAKIFDIEGDLELAKKLADGCVWAYESTVTGIMPEGSTVMQCESSAHCSWNETAYHRFLDPIADMREIQLQEYDANKRKQVEEAENAEKEAKALENTITEGGVPTTDPEQKSIRSEPNPASDAVSLRKRQSTPTEDKNGSGESKSLAKQSYDQKALSTEAELGSIATGRQAEVNHTDTATPTRKEESPVDPLRPISHQEFVESRIKQAGLPPGFVNIRSRKYSLRPEAIESVWYMYRITGDATWQDKGWKMFESIIKATSAKYGHSALHDVTAGPADGSHQGDEMESFWLAETLKYFYLLYSTPDTISLDDWVLNTEAHPFKRET